MLARHMANIEDIPLFILHKFLELNYATAEKLIGSNNAMAIEKEIVVEASRGFL